MNGRTESPRISVLILGGGVMQLPAIRIARRKGWRVLVADGSASAEGAALADRFLHVDLKDHEGMLRAASVERAGEGLDGIFTAGTDFSATVAYVAESLGLPGIPYRVARRASDKELMRQAFAEHGVPSPRFVIVRPGDDPAGAAGDLPFPLVVKPVDSMGARGVRRADSVDSLREAAREAIGCSRSSRAVVEEYLEGPEFSIDAIVCRGEIIPCGIADRIIRFAPFFVEMGHTMPSNYPADAIEEVLRVFRLGVEAIGIDHGAAKGDIKLTPNGAAVGEIAARLSGGYMSGWTFPLASGLEVTSAALDLAVGLPPGSLDPTKRHIAAERAFISIPGVVRGISGIETARSAPNVRELFVRTVPGDRTVFPENNVQKCGNVIASCADRSEAVDCAEKGARSVTIRLVPGEESTARFLFGPRTAFPPDAFSLAVPANRERLAAMPAWAGSLEETISAGTVRILTLPETDLEKSLDWHGASLADTIDRLFRESRLRPDWGGDPALGTLFWEVLLRGSLQGGLWLLDTLADWKNRGIDAERRMNAWRSFVAPSRS